MLKEKTPIQYIKIINNQSIHRPPSPELRNKGMSAWLTSSQLLEGLLI